MQLTDEQGYLIVAIDTDSSDYVTNATLLASSIKYWHPDAKICLLTNATVPDDTGLFAYVKPFRHPVNMANPWANDWQVFDATPFRETIKLEADMMITSAIDHWWTLLRHCDVVVSTGCRDWKDKRAVSRHYRKIFDANNLPDVYNAITYWRLSRTAKTFFNTVRNIFENWEQYKTLLKFPEDIPSTDVVYAMAANVITCRTCCQPARPPTCRPASQPACPPAEMSACPWRCTYDYSFFLNFLNCFASCQGTSARRRNRAQPSKPQVKFSPPSR